MNKESIINLYNKNNFEEFLKLDTTGEILNIFDKEGIEILKKSPLKIDRIRYILSFSPYKNELLKNMDFIDLILTSDINRLYAVMSDLDFISYENLLNRSIELNLSTDVIARLFNFFDKDFKLAKIKNKQLNQDLIITIFNKCYDAELINDILENYNIDLTNENINVTLLFEKCKKSVLKKQSVDSIDNVEITIHPHLITKDLAERLWNENNIYELRTILNNASYSTDTTLLNNYVKSREESIITKTKETLLYPFNELFEYFKTYKEQEYNFKNDRLNYNSDLHRESQYKCKVKCRELDIENMYQKLEELFLQNGINEVFNYVKQLSDENISNYIIDYHFEENYYNIMLDMNELLQYYYDGNIVIDREHLELYEQLVNIDYLSNEEKVQLHNQLKNYNMAAIFYDDMRIARDLVAENIKEYSLSKETINQYKNEELSNKYGVDVYVMNGNPFFGIVKTGRHVKDMYPTGHSYSLIGDKGLAVFGDPHKSGTLLYDASGLNKEQVVHVFPYDSYTIYRPYYYREEPSMRVNTLMTPEQLTTESYSYNEILILEQGTQETEIDKHIPELESIALYCLDNITEQDIEVAKQRNTGIILVDSSKYKQISKNKHSRNGYRENKYNYFNGTYEKQYHDQVRR